MKSILHYILKIFSKKILKKYKPDVIGITGSVGKTSSKEAVADVLSHKFSIRKSLKNYNNEVGVPLTIIGAGKTAGKSIFGWLKIFIKALRLILMSSKNYPDMLVLEMGADKPGDIQYLTDMVPCKVGVLTFISHAHTEFFKTIKKIAQEKRVIVSRLQPDGFAVLNFDNELTMETASVTKAEVITYGFKEGAQLRATGMNFFFDEKGWPAGINFKVLYKGNVVPIFLPGVISKSAVYAALAGLAVGLVFGVNLVEGAQALNKPSGLPGRMKLIRGIKETLIIDDTYNSSPEAAKAALDALAQIKVESGKEKYVVFGDMLELGQETENFHREIGFKIAELGVDFLLTVGEAAKHTAQSAKEAGMDEHRIATFSKAESAGIFLQDKLKQGDIALVKGSQSMRMEKIVKEVMAEPLLSPQMLVRQGKERLN